MDTETNFVVTVGFTTKVDHQTTSKISYSFHRSRQFRYFIGLEEKKGREEYNFRCAMNLARCHVCVPRRKREEAERQATEREIENRKRGKKINKSKTKQKTKTKKQTRKLKKQTEIQPASRWTCPSRRNRPVIVSP